MSPQTRLSSRDMTIGWRSRITLSRTHSLQRTSIAASMDHWMNFSVGSSACHIAVSQIQKRNELVVEIYISEDKELFHSLFDKKDAIEADAGLTFDWRELPERKASRIVIEKGVTFGDKNQWNAQFDWIIDVMLKMKKAFKKYL